jgi:hypothetical protein
LLLRVVLSGIINLFGVINLIFQLAKGGFMNKSLRTFFAVSFLFIFVASSYPQNGYPQDIPNSLNAFRFIKSEAGGYVQPLTLNNRILLGYETGFFPTLLLFYDLNYNFGNAVEADSNSALTTPMDSVSLSLMLCLNLASSTWVNLSPSCLF